MASGPGFSCCLVACCCWHVRCAFATSWLDSEGELSPETSLKLDKYVAWHKKSATRPGTKVFMLRPSNGLGDQLVNSVQRFLHYCILSKPRLRFEVAPREGSGDVGIWRVGVSPRIDVLHDAERTTRHNHTIVADVHKLDRAYMNTSWHLLQPTDAVRRLLLQPSPKVVSLLKQTLPADRPAPLVGVHVRTYAIDQSGMLDIDAGDGSARRLFEKLIGESVRCVVKAVEARKQAGSAQSAVFVTSDLMLVTDSLREAVQRQLPNVTVSSLPARPVHSNPSVTAGATDDEYEAVWASWFALMNADHVCGGRSMFAESVNQYSLREQSQGVPTSCEGGGWSILLAYSGAVARGKPANLQTLVSVVKDVERTMLWKMQSDSSCISQEVVDKYLAGRSKDGVATPRAEL